LRPDPPLSQGLDDQAPSLSEGLDPPLFRDLFCQVRHIQQSLDEAGNDKNVMNRINGLTCSIPIQMCEKDVVGIVTFDLAPVVQKVDSDIQRKKN